MNPEVVSKVKKSVIGKKYSELTQEEWDVLFKGSPSFVDTICIHNKIINDSGLNSNTCADAPPNMAGPASIAPPKPPVPVKVPTKPTK